MNSVKLFAAVFIIAINSNVHAQEELNKVQVIKYLKEIGDIECDQKDSIAEKYIFIVPLYIDSVDSGNTSSIFKFGFTASHSDSYILIQRNNNTEILRLEELDQDLTILLKHLSLIDNLTTEKCISITQNVINIYQQNQNNDPWVE